MYSKEFDFRLGASLVDCRNCDSSVFDSLSHEERELLILVESTPSEAPLEFLEQIVAAYGISAEDLLDYLTNPIVLPKNGS